MKPAFTYYGGKLRLAPRIVALLPKHTVYVEPYAGSAAVLFAKGYPNVSNTDHYREIINDNNDLLTSFYRCLQDHVLRLLLLERLALTPYSEPLYDEAARIVREGHGDMVTKAWAFFVNTQQSFSTKLLGGWRRGVCGHNHPFVWMNKVKYLSEVLERLSHVYITQVDALTCIDEWDAPQTCFYIDPPYVGADQGHYRGFKQEDLDRLVAKLDTIEGSFLLSGYDNAAYPSHWERFEFAATASGLGLGKAPPTRRTPTQLKDRKRKEIVLRKISAVEPREDLKPLMRSIRH